MFFSCLDLGSDHNVYITYIIYCFLLKDVEPEAWPTLQGLLVHPFTVGVDLGVPTETNHMSDRNRTCHEHFVKQR